MSPEKIARFHTLYTKSDGCWLWRGELSRAGYGRFKADTRKVAAHRISYELHVGPIPDGLTIDHLCRVHNCVNPAHLEPVTQRENLLRGLSVQAINAKKTHCVRGHELNEENVYRTAKGRHCKTCRVEYNQRPEMVAYMKAYQSNPEHRARHNEANRRYKQKLRARGSTAQPQTDNSNI